MSSLNERYAQYRWDRPTGRPVSGSDIAEVWDAVAKNQELNGDTAAAERSRRTAEHFRSR